MYEVSNGEREREKPIKYEIHHYLCKFHRLHRNVVFTWINLMKHNYTSTLDIHQ